MPDQELLGASIEALERCGSAVGNPLAPLHDETAPPRNAIPIHCLPVGHARLASQGATQVVARWGVEP
jgi:hypothetical protein